MRNATRGLRLVPARLAAGLLPVGTVVMERSSGDVGQMTSEGIAWVGVTTVSHGRGLLEVLRVPTGPDDVAVLAASSMTLEDPFTLTPEAASGAEGLGAQLADHVESLVLALPPAEGRHVIETLIDILTDDYLAAPTGGGAR